MLRSAIIPASRCCRDAGSLAYSSASSCCLACSVSMAIKCASIAAEAGPLGFFRVVICIARVARVAWASRSRDVGIISAPEEGSPVWGVPPRLLLLADGCVKETDDGVLCIWLGQLVSVCVRSTFSTHHLRIISTHISTPSSHPATPISLLSYLFAVHAGLQHGKPTSRPSDKL